MIFQPRACPALLVPAQLLAPVALIRVNTVMLGTFPRHRALDALRAQLGNLMTKWVAQDVGCVPRAFMLAALALKLAPSVRLARTQSQMARRDASFVRLARTLMATQDTSRKLVSFSHSAIRFAFLAHWGRTG